VDVEVGFREPSEVAHPPIMAWRPGGERRVAGTETLRSRSTYSAETASLLVFFQQNVEGLAR
jgi:hypothetical protein